MSKNMMKLTLGLLAVGCVLATACPVSAEVIWDGSVSPTNAGYTLSGSGSNPFTFNSPLGFTYQDSSDSEMAVWEQSFVGTELVRANGWFVETRLKPIANSPAPNYGVHMSVRDDVDGVIVTMHPDNIVVRDYENTKHYVPIAVEEYHTIRVVMDPSGTNCDVYVDDMNTPAVSVVGNAGSGARTAFGDACSSTAGEASWDYLVVNGEIPEPGTMALLVTGLLGLLCYAWRKHK